MNNRNTNEEFENLKMKVQIQKNQKSQNQKLNFYV